MSEVQNTPTESIQSPSKTGKRWFLMVGVPVIALAVCGGLYLKGGQSVETDNAYVKANLVSVSSEVSGAIAKVNAQENQHVEAGQVLFQIDSRTYEVAVHQAEAQLAQVARQISTLKASYTQMVTELELAQSRYDYARAEDKRQVDLLAKKYISSSEYDAVKQNTRIAGLQLVSAEQALNQVLQSLGGNPDLPLEQHPDYLSANAALEQAKLNLEHTTILAPTTGIVRVPPQKGQFLSAGLTALSLVEDTHFWIEANYPEKDLTYVQTGQEVEIRVDAYPDFTWKGTVESLSPGTSAEFSILPAQNGTGNWVKVSQRVPVRIQIEEQAGLPSLRSGFSTIVAIDTEHKRSILGFTL